MNIGIDIRSTLKRKTGIGYYTFNLINNLAAIDKHNNYFLFSKIGLFNKNKILPSLPGSNFKHIINRLNLDPKFLLKNLVVFHTSSYDLPKPKKAKLVLAVHDVIHKIYPAVFSQETINLIEKNLKNILPQADAIIVSSLIAKRDLLKFYEVDENKIYLVYLGVEGHQRFESHNQISNDYFFKKYKIISPFILFVGTIEPRKNIDGLIKAYSILKEEKGLRHKLVIAGMKGWLYEKIFILVKDKNLEEDIIFTGYLKEEELYLLYGSADIFVYPSFYEGTGLPVLEALSFGLPTVTSKDSTMAEIAQDSVLTVDPYRAEDIAQAILRLIEDKEFSDILSIRGIQKAKEFSWQNTAQKTLEIFMSVQS